MTACKECGLPPQIIKVHRRMEAKIEKIETRLKEKTEEVRELKKENTQYKRDADRLGRAAERSDLRRVSLALDLHSANETAKKRRSETQSLKRKIKQLETEIDRLKESGKLDAQTIKAARALLCTSN